jgi:FkbM family methyltransferase
MFSDLIFDVGMFNGNDTQFYLDKGFRVVAVEADPELAAAGTARFSSQIAENRLTIVNRAIAEQPGRVTFFVNQVSKGWSSIDLAAASPRGTEVRKVEVEGTRFADLLREHGIPYYLKCDIEGADSLVLAGLDELAVRPPYVSVECHTIEHLVLLKQLGYRSFKIVNQTLHHLSRLPDPPLEGRYVHVERWLNASGPFGRETPGDRWLGFNEAAEILTTAKRLCGYPSVMHGWFDCHARLQPPGASETDVPGVRPGSLSSTDDVVQLP